MMRIALLLALILGWQSASAEKSWLLIGASDPTAIGLLTEAAPLSAEFAQGLIIQTSDCQEKHNVFAWTLDVYSSAKAAQAALPRLRQIVGDAYVKSCEVKPGSLLAFHISVIDPTIANVPADSVNWQERDRISSILPLEDGRSIVIVRYFSAYPDDPLEGRRERVELIDSANKRLLLEGICIDPDKFAPYHQQLAFQCVSEQAGDHSLHHIVVFDALAHKVADLQHCREPNWSDSRSINCLSESVAADGKLELNIKRYELTE